MVLRENKLTKMKTATLDIETLKHNTALGKKNFEQEEGEKEAKARKSLNLEIEKRSEQILEEIVSGIKLESEKGNYKHYHPVIYSDYDKRNWANRRTYINTGTLIMDRERDAEEVTKGNLYKLNTFKKWSPRKDKEVRYLGNLKDITIEYLATRRAISQLFKQVPAGLSFLLMNTMVSINKDNGGSRDLQFSLLRVSWKD